MAVATRYLVKGRNKVNVHVTGVWAVADETDTVVIDKSALVGPDGTEPGAIRVDEITWAIGGGYEYIQLEWDHTTDDICVRLAGQGYMDFRPSGGLNDPRSAGDTGDLILTAQGGAAGDIIDLLIHCTLKD
jgi:hypothetical protein